MAKRSASRVVRSGVITVLPTTWRSISSWIERGVSSRGRTAWRTGRIPLLGHHLEQGHLLVGHPSVRSDHLLLEGPDVADVGGRLEAGRGPAGEHASVEGQAAERPRPGLAADVVDDHGDTAASEHAGLAEQAVHRADEILLRRVDGVVGAELAELLELPGCAAGHDDFGSGGLGDLQAARTDSPRRTQDEDLLARLDLGPV